MTDQPCGPASEGDAFDMLDGTKKRFAHFKAWGWLAAGIMVLLVVGVGTVQVRQGSHAIDGTVTLGVGAWSYDPSVLTGIVSGNYSGTGGTVGTLPQGSSCDASQGYDDVDQGSDVTILNESGDIIATARLGPGHTNVEARINLDKSGLAAAQCIFRFSTGVPRAKFYKIEIGRRQGPTFSYAEMVSEHWEPGLVLG